MLKILLISLCMGPGSVWGDDHDHDHGEKKTVVKQSAHKDEHEDEHNEGHGHKDEHGHAEEMSADGFKLTDKAIKNFELITIDYVSQPVTVPSKAIFRGLAEVNVYRLRNGFYKRIDFKTIEKTRDHLKISSPDLATGDKIVVNGLGFLRIAEIAASGGLSDSHSH